MRFSLRALLCGVAILCVLLVVGMKELRPRKNITRAFVRLPNRDVYGLETIYWKPYWGERRLARVVILIPEKEGTPDAHSESTPQGLLKIDGDQSDIYPPDGPDEEGRFFLWTRNGFQRLDVPPAVVADCRKWAAGTAKFGSGAAFSRYLKQIVAEGNKTENKVAFEEEGN